MCSFVSWKSKPKCETESSKKLMKNAALPKSKRNKQKKNWDSKHKAQTIIDSHILHLHKLSSPIYFYLKLISPC